MVVLRRSMWDRLVDWRSRPHHPVVLGGLRQTGKTYLVRAFGEQHYGNVVYLDLSQNRDVHVAFDGKFDVDHMVASITAIVPCARFVAHDTLLILDEIPDCPDAWHALKNWDLDGRFDVIAMGTLRGVRRFPHPSLLFGHRSVYEERMTLRPLSFAEFLDNAGIPEKWRIYAQYALQDREPLLPTVHEQLRSLYLQFLVVGGMPQAVATFLGSHDLDAVREIQKSILTSIRDDFGHPLNARGEYVVNEALKLCAEACLDSLPAQLTKGYKRFQYSKVNLSGDDRQKRSGLNHLVDVGLVTKVYNLRRISAPLEDAKLGREFKAFFVDTGLLMSQLEREAAMRVMAGDLSAHKGAVAESMVASAFATAGKELYYYHARRGSPDLDFVASLNGEPTIVDCKSAHGLPTSMHYVLEHPDRFGTHPAIKLADTNVEAGDGFFALPLYALGLLPPQTSSLWWWE